MEVGGVIASGLVTRVGSGGDGWREYSAAPTDDDSSSLFGAAVRGRSTAENRPETPRCRLRQQDNFDNF